MEPHTLRDIEQVSLDLLSDSKSLDVFPTPITKLVYHGGLTVDHTISIGAIHASYLAKDMDILQKAASKVRGLLDRTTGTIFLDREQLPCKQNFVTLHEVGHHALPWQRDFHQVLEDDDDSLDDDYKEQFELEANYFASVTLFQHDRFEHELIKYGTGIEAAQKLGKVFGASVHASLRKMVLSSVKRCALLVLENISAPKTVAQCFKRDLFLSPKFIETFGSIELPDQFGYKWPFVKQYYHRNKWICKGEVSLATQNGEADFEYQFFNNTYNGFVFLYPTGEIQKAKSKVILTTASD